MKHVEEGAVYVVHLLPNSIDGHTSARPRTISGLNLRRCHHRTKIQLLGKGRMIAFAVKRVE